MIVRHSQLSIGGISVDVHRKRIKHLYFVVSHRAGAVRVSAPLRLHDDVLRAAIAARLPWIRRQIAKAELRPVPPALEYITGENHMFLGLPRRLNVIADAARATITLQENTLHLFVPPGGDAAMRKRITEAWYRRQLKGIIPRLAEQWEAVTGVHASEWGVKRMKTKWGTCNVRARRIWLNLELAKHPVRLIEYIVVHELVHLLERRHNARFRGFMDVFMPDWRSRLTELNGPTTLRSNR